MNWRWWEGFGKGRGESNSEERTHQKGTSRVNGWFGANLVTRRKTSWNQSIRHVPECPAGLKSNWTKLIKRWETVWWNQTLPNNCPPFINVGSPGGFFSSSWKFAWRFFLRLCDYSPAMDIECHLIYLAHSLCLFLGLFPSAEVQKDLTAQLAKGASELQFFPLGSW